LARRVAKRVKWLAQWLDSFGLAVGLHACWNGGSLLIVTLVGQASLGSAAAN